jgi:hypothetical protein
VTLVEAIIFIDLVIFWMFVTDFKRMETLVSLGLLSFSVAMDLRDGARTEIIEKYLKKLIFNSL